MYHCLNCYYINCLNLKFEKNSYSTSISLFSFVYSQTGWFLNKTISDIGDSLSIDKFKFDTNKLKRFTIENDTSYIDTSLTIKKFYKFNYIRKDDFELVKLNNVGQIYNQLTYNSSNNNLLSFGYNANNILLTNKSEVNFMKLLTQ